MSGTGANSGAGGSRFSMSFAKDDQNNGSSCSDQEMNVVEVMEDDEEFQKDSDLFRKPQLMADMKESLINQIQGG